MIQHDLRLLTSAVLVVLSALSTACSDWDAAVGVRCTEAPAFCRAPTTGTQTDGGAGGGDGGTTTTDGGTPTPITDGGVDGAAPMTVLFGRDIRPLMNRTETDPTGPGCSACHYTTTGTQIGILDGQLDMTTLGKLRRGGKTSANNIIVPGKPDASALVQKLRGTYAVGSRMPWNGPPYWTDAEIQLVATWIAEGARGADDE
jgi:hypothetical protein